MRMRKLGHSGLYVSELCFGAMTFGGTGGIWEKVGTLGQDEADALVRAAVEAGINFLDTANTYADGCSEEILGQSLRNLGIARDDIVIATKGGAPMGDGPNQRGGSRRHILKQCHDSLKRLGLDHVDLYQIHEFDPETPIEETLEALDTLVREGDVRYVGLSNWAAWQIMKAVGIAQARTLVPVISMQAYYSLVGRDVEREIVPLLESEQIGMMVWSPLAGGYLTGKYASGGEGRLNRLDFPPIDRTRGEGILTTLSAVADKHRTAPSTIALAWLAAKPVVTSVIIGARTTEQLSANVQATNIVLDADDLAALDAISSVTPEYPAWVPTRHTGAIS